jgi:SAM-dependent methyltransferase
MGPDLRETFFTELRASVQDGTMVKLTLGKPRGGETDLQNLYLRPLTLRGMPHLSLVWRHETKDITKNFSPAEALARIEPLIGTKFHSAHLFTTARTTQLEFNKKGEPRYSFGPAAAREAQAGHDQPKPGCSRLPAGAWLEALEVINPAGTVRPGMADKHRQIHKFVEILSHLMADVVLPDSRPIEIADMGCGKGYLTFATHDYFNLVAARPANVVGIEARSGLVEKCRAIARSAGCARLTFQAGTIQSAQFLTLDVLIALHACDTATDDALAKRRAAGAALLVVSPCCQKELRPQLQAAPVLAPALRHGIFQERHAEFATDALRALLLEWAGYDTKVFEFIATEHTAKNLMIAATKRPGPGPHRGGGQPACASWPPSTGSKRRRWPAPLFRPRMLGFHLFNP